MSCSSSGSFFGVRSVVFRPFVRTTSIDLAAVVLERRADRHLAVRVTVLAALGDAVEQPDHRATRGALARFVRSEDHLDAAAVEAELLVAKRAERDEVERAEPHPASSLVASRAWTTQRLLRFAEERTQRLGIVEAERVVAAQDAHRRFVREIGERVVGEREQLVVAQVGERRERVDPLAARDRLRRRRRLDAELLEVDALQDRWRPRGAPPSPARALRATRPVIDSGPRTTSRAARRRPSAPSSSRRELRARGVDHIGDGRRPRPIVTAHSAQRTTSSATCSTDSMCPFSSLDERRALRASLAHVSALQIAREHDPRIAREHLALMHVAERPIVVPARTQRIELARRVRARGRRAAVRTRVEQTDVEHARDRLWVVDATDLRSPTSLRKAPPVHRDAEVFVDERLRPRRVRASFTFSGRWSLLRDDARRVVVAVDDRDAHARFAQARHLVREEEARSRNRASRRRRDRPRAREATPSIRCRMQRASRTRGAGLRARPRAARRRRAEGLAAGCRCAGRRHARFACQRRLRRR